MTKARPCAGLSPIRNAKEDAMREQTAASAEALARLIHWLKERRAAVLAAERQALQRLEEGDIPGHAQKMREKAQLLAALSEEAKPLLAPLPGEARFNLALALERFSSSARTALKLDSVFYMSALLYPDDHKKGEPDNFLLFIERVEREGEPFA